MRSEYNFRELPSVVRGKYAERYRQGTNLVLLEQEVAEAFPDSESVNNALRMLMKVAENQAQKGGAKVGQVGTGRQVFRAAEADEVRVVEVEIVRTARNKTAAGLAVRKAAAERLVGVQRAAAPAPCRSGAWEA